MHKDGRRIVVEASFGYAMYVYTGSSCTPSRMAGTRCVLSNTQYPFTCMVLIFCHPMHAYNVSFFSLTIASAMPSIQSVGRLSM